MTSAVMTADGPVELCLVVVTGMCLSDCGYSVSVMPRWHTATLCVSYIDWVTGLCWAGTWLTGWEHHICSVYSISSWQITYEWHFQVYVINCSHSCLQWRRRLKNTRISVLMIQLGKLRLWCSEFFLHILFIYTNFYIACGTAILNYDY